MTDDPETQYDPPAEPIPEPVYDWGRLRSWHLLPLGSWSTLCGKEVASRARVPFPPSNERTCERCFQLRENKETPVA